MTTISAYRDISHTYTDPNILGVQPKESDEPQPPMPPPSGHNSGEPVVKQTEHRPSINVLDQISAHNREIERKKVAEEARQKTKADSEIPRNVARKLF